MKRRLGKQGQIDYYILLAVFVLVVIGMLAVSSASVVLSYDRFGDNFFYLKRHFVYVAIGLLAMGATSFIDYRFWRKYAYQLMILTIVLLVTVFIPGLGQELGGARAWIFLGPISIQPAEFVKLTFLLYLAAWLERQGEGIRHLQSGFVPFIIIMGTIATLIMLQPDLGTLTIIVAMAAAMFFTAGSSITQIGLSLGGIVGVFYLMVLVAPYRLQRLLTFLNPKEDCLGAGYQICQSLLGIGSGGLLGVGFGQSKQKYLYLPQAHTDSIFVIMAEELGFIRSALIVLVYAVIGVRGFKIAEKAPDMYGRLVAVGITSWIIFQTFVNIGTTLSIVPLTGVTLPFISSGGSSLIVTLAAVGVLLNISKQVKHEQV